MAGTAARTATRAAAWLLLLGAAGGGAAVAAAGPGPGPADSYSGLLRAEADIQVNARVAGLVVSVAHPEGDAVGPGEAVVVLDDADEVLRIALAKADLETAETTLLKMKSARPEELARARALLEESRAGLVLAEKRLKADQEMESRGILSELGRQTSERALEAARAQAESRRLDLVLAEQGARAEDLRLAALEVERKRLHLRQAERDAERRRVAGTRPGRAFVSRVHVEPGQWIEAGKAAVDLVYIDRLKVEIDLPAAAGLALARGAKATVKVPAFGATLEGRVDRVAPVVDAASGTVRCVVLAENPGLKVRPGVEAEVAIHP
jgi:multidrug resistance efflux pump